MQSGWFGGCLQLRPGTAPEHYPVRNEKPSPILGLAGSLLAGRGRRREAWPARHQSTEATPIRASFASARCSPLASHFFTRVCAILFIAFMYTRARSLCCPLFAICIISKRPNYFSAACCCLCFAYRKERKWPFVFWPLSACSLFNLANPLWSVAKANICCVSSCHCDPKAWVAT